MCPHQSLPPRFLPVLGIRAHFLPECNLANFIPNNGNHDPPDRPKPPDGTVNKTFTVDPLLKKSVADRREMNWNIRIPYQKRKQYKRSKSKKRRASVKLLTVTPDAPAPENDVGFFGGFFSAALFFGRILYHARSQRGKTEKIKFLRIFLRFSFRFPGRTK